MLERTANAYLEHFKDKLQPEHAVTASLYHFSQGDLNSAGKALKAALLVARKLPGTDPRRKTVARFAVSGLRHLEDMPQRIRKIEGHPEFLKLLDAGKDILEKYLKDPLPFLTSSTHHAVLKQMLAYLEANPEATFRQKSVQYGQLLGRQMKEDGWTGVLTKDMKRQFVDHVASLFEENTELVEEKIRQFEKEPGFIDPVGVSVFRHVIAAYETEKIRQLHADAARKDGLPQNEASTSFLVAGPMEDALVHLLYAKYLKDKAVKDAYGR